MTKTAIYVLPTIDGSCGHFKVDIKETTLSFAISPNSKQARFFMKVEMGFIQFHLGSKISIDNDEAYHGAQLYADNLAGVIELDDGVAFFLGKWLEKNGIEVNYMANDEAEINT